ncbi:hypothetical protein H4219_000993 [Mycoemilia scoparia]|uniref:MICOS complex subunit n=1 Tax=Mycoemilia scoparia TaxID=417184 RepID=A0A9W8DSE1_9FUNG|nr:hypothetical protein H4219_000993 [Mycoemilia scoparia]
MAFHRLGIKKSLSLFVLSNGALLTVTAPLLTDSEKKSIYDEDVRVYPTSEPQSVLAEYIATSRKFACENLCKLKTEAQGYVDKWISIEKQVAKTVKETVPKNESLMPGAVYVLLAGLAGPIFTRKRNILVRWTSPILFGSLAAAYFLPGTTNTAVTRVWGRYGDPEALQNIKDTWAQVKNSQAIAQQKLAEKIRKIRESIESAQESKVSQATSRVDEVLSSAKDEAEKVVSKVNKEVQEVGSDVKAKTEKIEANTEEVMQKIEADVKKVKEEPKSLSNDGKTIYDILSEKRN